MAGMLKCNTASSDLTLSVSFLAIKNRLRISPNRVERGNSTAQPRTGEATQLDQEKKIVEWKSRGKTVRHKNGCLETIAERNRRRYSAMAGSARGDGGLADDQWRSSSKAAWEMR